MHRALRFFIFLLAFSMLVSLTSCAKYPAVSSSKEERATVFTVDGEYEAPYELYRFVFLNVLAAKGDSSQWDEAEKKQVFDECDAAARKEIARVYAVFSLCEEYDIEPYSKEINKAVNQAVADSIEAEDGGFGDYDTYLKVLSEGYMNDSVFRFYLRLDICEEYLAKAMHSASFVKEDDETVRAHFKGEDTVHATWIYIPYSSSAYENFTDAMLTSLVEQAKEASDEEFVSMSQQFLQPLYMLDELAEGFYFGKYQLDPYYETLTNTAFALGVGETSDIIHSGDGIYIVRRLAKDDTYIEDESHIALLREYYLLDCFYRVLGEESTRLIGTLKAEKAYGNITLDSVKMGE